MVGKAGLITVIGFSIILGFISLNMARVAKNAIGNMASYADATLSHNLATTGANIGLARFYSRYDLVRRYHPDPERATLLTEASDTT